MIVPCKKCNEHPCKCEVIKKAEDDILWNINRPIYNPVRTLIREKMIQDDEMYNGCIKEVIKFLKNDEIKAAHFLLQDIYLVKLEKEQER